MRTELTTAQREWWDSNYACLSRMVAKRHQCSNDNVWQERIANTIAICWQEYLRRTDRYYSAEIPAEACHDLVRQGVYLTNKKRIMFGSEHKGRIEFEKQVSRADYRDTLNAFDSMASRETDPATIVELRLDFQEWYAGLKPQEKLVISYLLGGLPLAGRNRKGIDSKLKTTLRSLRRMLAKLESKWSDYHAGILSLYAMLGIVS